MSGSIFTAVGGRDSLIWKGIDRSADLAKDEIIKIAAKGELVKGYATQSGGIASFSVEGKQATLTCHAMVGTQMFSDVITEWQNRKTNHVGTGFSTITLIKNLGDNSGNIKKVTYILEGVFVAKMPDASSNVSGAAESAIAEISFEALNFYVL